MAKSAARRAIEGAGYVILRSERLPNDTGRRYVLAGRKYVNVYDTGTMHPDGRVTAEDILRLNKAFGLEG